MDREPSSFNAYKLLAWLMDKPMSGYDIKKRVASASQLFGSDSNSQIYPILRQLERYGWVKSEVDETSGKRARKLYSITEEGQKNMLLWMLAPCSPTPYKDELLMKMSMGFHITESDWQHHLAYYQNELDDTHQLLEKKLAHIEKDHNAQKNQRYLAMAHKHLMMISQARRDWCQLCLDEFVQEE